MNLCKVLPVLLCSMALPDSEAASPTNAPPEVRIVYPYAEGGLYRWPATVKMIAEATDSDGHIAKVEFLADGQLLATVTNAPYVFRWEYLGDWDVRVWLMARAYDDGGLSADSAPVPIFITQDPGLPWVVLAEPADGAILGPRQRARVIVKMYQTDDALGEVEVLQGTNVVAHSSDPPYEFFLGPFAPGDYRFQARGRVLVGPEWSLSSTSLVRVIELRLTQASLSNGLFQFQIEGLPTNQPYGVRVSTNLRHWTLIATNSAGGLKERFGDSFTNLTGPRFYQVVAPPQVEVVGE